LWVRYHSLLNVNKKVIGIFFLLVGGTYFGIFHHSSPTKAVCSQFDSEADSNELQTTREYFRRLKGQLPDDNSSMFKKFFNQHVVHLTDELSQFISDNTAGYMSYFGVYIIGIGILLIVLVFSRLKSNKLIMSASARDRNRTVLKLFRLGLLAIIVLMSFWSLAKSY
jgi:hypothetical protein